MSDIDILMQLASAKGRLGDPKIRAMLWNLAETKKQKIDWSQLPEEDVLKFAGGDGSRLSVTKQAYNIAANQKRTSNEIGWVQYLASKGHLSGTTVGKINLDMLALESPSADVYSGLSKPGERYRKASKIQGVDVASGRNLASATGALQAFRGPSGDETGDKNRATWKSYYAAMVPPAEQAAWTQEADKQFNENSFMGGLRTAALGLTSPESMMQNAAMAYGFGLAGRGANLIGRVSPVGAKLAQGAITAGGLGLGVVKPAVESVIANANTPEGQRQSWGRIAGEQVGGALPMLVDMGLGRMGNAHPTEPVPGAGPLERMSYAMNRQRLPFNELAPVDRAMSMRANQSPEWRAFYNEAAQTGATHEQAFTAATEARVRQLTDAYTATGMDPAIAVALATSRVGAEVGGGLSGKPQPYDPRAEGYAEGYSTGKPGVIPEKAIDPTSPGFRVGIGYAPEAIVGSPEWNYVVGQQLGATDLALRAGGEPPIHPAVTSELGYREYVSRREQAAHNREMYDQSLNAESNRLVEAARIAEAQRIEAERLAEEQRVAGLSPGARLREKLGAAPATPVMSLAEAESAARAEAARRQNVRGRISVIPPREGATVAPPPKPEPAPRQVPAPRTPSQSASVVQSPRQVAPDAASYDAYNIQRVNRKSYAPYRPAKGHQARAVFPDVAGVVPTHQAQNAAKTLLFRSGNGLYRVEDGSYYAPNPREVIHEINASNQATPSTVYALHGQNPVEGVILRNGHVFDHATGNRYNPADLSFRVNPNQASETGAPQGPKPAPVAGRVPAPVAEPTPAMPSPTAGTGPEARGGASGPLAAAASAVIQAANTQLPHERAGVPSVPGPEGSVEVVRPQRDTSTVDQLRSPTGHVDVKGVIDEMGPLGPDTAGNLRRLNTERIRRDANWTRRFSKIVDQVHTIASLGKTKKERWENFVDIIEGPRANRNLLTPDLQSVASDYDNLTDEIGAFREDVSLKNGVDPTTVAPSITTEGYWPHEHPGGYMVIKEHAGGKRVEHVAFAKTMTDASAEALRIINDAKMRGIKPPDLKIMEAARAPVNPHAKMGKPRLGANVSRVPNRLEYSKNPQVMLDHISAVSRYGWRLEMDSAVKGLIDTLGDRPGAVDYLLKYRNRAVGFPTSMDRMLGNTIRNSRFLRDRVKNPDRIMTDLSAWTRSATNLVKIRFNPKSALANLTQPEQTLAPIVGQKIFQESRGKVRSEWARLKQDHVLLGDLKYSEMGDPKYTEAGPLDLMANASNFNRAHGYLAGEMYWDRTLTAADKAEFIRRGGFKDEASARDQYARDMAERTEFDNSVHNRALLLTGPLVETLFQYKGYQLKSLESMLSILKNPKDTPVQKLGKVLRSNAVASALGGAKGVLPVIGAVSAPYVYTVMYDIAKKKGYDDEAADRVGLFASQGIPAMVGTDLSSSISTFDAPWGDTPEKQVVAAAMGPTVGTQLRFIRDLKKALSEENPYKMQEELWDTLVHIVPQMSGPRQGYDILTKGPDSGLAVSGGRWDSKNPILDAIQMTGGFMPTIKAEKYAIKERVDAWKTRGKISAKAEEWMKRRGSADTIPPG